MRVQWSAAIDALIIYRSVPFRFTLQCEARGKGVSEQSELTPCVILMSLLCPSSSGTISLERVIYCIGMFVTEPSGLCC